MSGLFVSLVLDDEGDCAVIGDGGGCGDVVSNRSKVFKMGIGE